MKNKDVIEVDDSTWEKNVEKESSPVVVMFYSPICPHCREMNPYFEEYATEYTEKIIFARINVINNPTSTSRYGVMGTPTFKFFCGGRPIKEFVGAVYPSLLRTAFDELLTYGSKCIEKSTKVNHGITGYA